MRVSAILAAATNGVIGLEGQLPWRLRTDVRRFKRLTTGHHVVMGRRTWEEIGCRPLPHRTCVVLSRRPGFEAPGAMVHGSLEAAIEAARRAGEEEFFVIGGAGLFGAAFRFADRVYLTRVLAEVEGDTAVDLSPLEGWRVERWEDVAAGPEDDHATRFEVLAPPECGR
ncbi:MAG: dihydrofolate reductase [Acidobacteriota bacterium]|nr:dihydrofolate reductase [Acidobacteriota bacterium]MDE2922136.1 dihydrofolate reductase [Acidobacteriota bacterium]MDE3265815.1 dihydrofolate reductase [Acidobacteriota bacterium]